MTNKTDTQVTTTTTARRGRKVNPNSVLSQCRVLFKAAHNVLSRKQMVNAFQSEVGTSPGVANTYYHLLARENEKNAPKAVAADGKRGRGRPRGKTNATQAKAQAKAA